MVINTVTVFFCASFNKIITNFQKRLGQVLTLWNLIFYTKIRPHSINTLNR